MKTYRLVFGEDWIEVVAGRNGGSVESNLMSESTGPDDDCREWNAAVDTLEGMLLAMACEGVDLNDKRIKSAVETMLDSLANQYG